MNYGSTEVNNVVRSPRQRNLNLLLGKKTLVVLTENHPCVCLKKMAPTPVGKVMSEAECLVQWALTVNWKERRE